jgi:hypothetical protein
MTKLRIVGEKQRMITFLGDINGRGCTKMSTSTSNHAKSVNDVLEYDMRNLYILHGVLLFGKR